MRNRDARKKCKPCEGGVSPVKASLAKKKLKQLQDWQLSKKADRLSVCYVMKDFSSAIRFIRRIADIAEAENHHPDLHLTAYRRLEIHLTTHAIGGLSENDFILAAKIDELPKKIL